MHCLLTVPCIACLQEQVWREHSRSGQSWGPGLEGMHMCVYKCIYIAAICVSLCAVLVYSCSDVCGVGTMRVY